jgi:hypothetical protein
VLGEPVQLGGAPLPVLLGARYLGGSGRVEWLAAFAPVGPAELRAFVPGVSASAELDEPLVAEPRWACTRSWALRASTWRCTGCQPATR